jgi:AcrR family transcriptional regulator
MTNALAVNDNLETAKRQQILAGARMCFLAQGFDGASMNDIVRTAGVSKGTVYAYFSSKEKLFEALIFEDRRRQAEQAVVIEDDRRPVEEVLHDLGLRMAKLVTSPDSIAYVRMVVAASDKFPEIGRAFYEAGPAYGARIISSYLQRKMDEGVLRMSDSRLAAMQFVELVLAGLVKPKMFASEKSAGNYEAETVVSSGVALFLGGMRQHERPVNSGQK